MNKFFVGYSDKKPFLGINGKMIEKGKELVKLSKLFEIIVKFRERERNKRKND